MRRWMTFVVLALVLAAACSDGGDEAEGRTTTAAAAAEDAVCERSDELDRVTRVFGTAGFWDLSIAEVRRRYAAGDRLIGQIRDATDDEDLERWLREALRAREQYVPVLLDELEDHHDELEEIGYFWADAVMDGEAADDGAREAFFASRQLPWSGRLQTTCEAPELARLPEEDRAGEVSGGTVVYRRLGERGPGALFAIPAAGGRPVALPPPPGWDEIAQVAVTGDARTTMVALALRAERTPHQAIVEGSLRGGFAVVQEVPDDVRVECVQQEQGSGDFLVTTSDASYRSTLLRIDDAGEETTVPIDSRHFACAVPQADGEVLLPGSGDPKTFGDIHRTGADGGRIEPVFGDDDCNELALSLSPATSDAAVFQTCLRPRDSGLLVVRPDGTTASTPVRGPAGAPAWSPDGEWLVLAHGPLGTRAAETFRLWQVRRDGSGLRRLTDEPSSFAVWVADEL